MASTISHTDYYELTNGYGPTFPLAVAPSSVNLGLRVASKDDNSLFWQFLTAPDPTKFNICTHYLGNFYCLDIVGGNPIAPHLAAPAYVTGQQWTLIPTKGSSYKLSNDYSGVGYYLDTYSDDKVAFMNTGDFGTQYWALNDEGAQPATSAAAATSTAVVSATRTAVVTVTTAQSQSALSPPSSAASTFVTSPIPALTGSTAAPTSMSSSSNGGLSTGAEVGAIVGPIFAAVTMGIAIYRCAKSRRENRGY